MERENFLKGLRKGVTYFSRNKKKSIKRAKITLCRNQG